MIILPPPSIIMHLDFGFVRLNTQSNTNQEEKMRSFRPLLNYKEMFESHVLLWSQAHATASIKSSNYLRH